MNRKIIYFINPVSGTRGKEAVTRKIEERTTLQQIPFEIMHTNAEGNYYFLKEKIRDEQITDIVVCGGDGTINKVAGALLDEDIRVGIIPMGSGNGLAFAAKIPKNTDKALDIIFNGKASYIDSFFINAAFSCMLCGLGFDAQVAEDFSKQPKRGLATYAKQTFINFLNIHAWPFEIISKGKSFPTSAYFISIANSNQFGNHFTIAPHAKLNDGLLDIVIVKKMSRPRFIWTVLQQVRNGKPMEYDAFASSPKDVLYFQTDTLIIRNPASAPLHIDGDPSHSAKEFTIRVIPDAFKLIQPK